MDDSPARNGVALYIERMALKQLHKGSEEQRGWKVMEVSRAADARYVPQLLARMRDESSERVRRHIVRALGNIGGARVREELLRCLERESGLILGDLARALGSLNERRAIEQLEKLVHHAETWVADGARDALKRLR